MKFVKYILPIALAGVALTSCSDLDLQSKGILDENILFNSDFGIQKYFVSLYQELPIENLNYYQSGSPGYTPWQNASGNAGNRWEAQKNSPATCAGEGLGWGTGYGTWGFWPYNKIRLINNFIEGMEAYRDNYSEEDFNNYIGEARFLRAYYYFGMVKRMGGVPIVDKVLDPTAPDDELRQPRDTEYDCWKFIYEDLKYGMENMHDNNGTGRANKYVCAALASRVCLYAATIAHYNPLYSVSGPATQQGLMKMEGDDIVREFGQYCLDACEMVRQGGYKLHTGADKAVAFSQVFVESTDEDIFVRGGVAANYNNGAGHNWGMYNSWDSMTLPFGTGLAQAVGAALTPTFESIMLFEHPDLVDEHGYPTRFDSRDDFWKNYEPRGLGTIFFSGMTEVASGVIFDFQTGIYDECNLTYDELTPESDGQDNDYIKQHRERAGGNGVMSTRFPDIQCTGKHGGGMNASNEGGSRASSVIRKYIDYTAAPTDRGLNAGKLPFKAFRYGEILCNEMEAAYEMYMMTGNSSYLDRAQNCLDQLRERAGASHYTLVANPEDVGMEKYGVPIDSNLQFIREERERELMFENHKVFDLMRWRIYDLKYDNYWMHMMTTYYIVSEQKWIFLGEVDWIRGGQARLNFDKRNYYQGVNMDGNNLLIIQNDGH